jgi:hypothetical protein
MRKRYQRRPISKGCWRLGEDIPGQCVGTHDKHELRAMSAGKPASEAPYTYNSVDRKVRSA